MCNFTIVCCDSPEAVWHLQAIMDQLEEMQSELSDEEDDIDSLDTPGFTPYDD